MASNEKFAEDIKKTLEASKQIPQEKLLFTYNGVLYPSTTCQTETFKAIENFESREDDIMMVAYPKCGSNWTIQLLHDMVHLIYNKVPPPAIPLIEFGAPDKFEKLKNEASPRVLGSHLHYDNIPKSIFDKKVKLLVVFRNPKDTAVSYYHFYNNNPVLPTYSSWDIFFQDFMSGNVCWGSYFDHAVAWNKHIDDEGVMIMTFEEMKQDLEGSVKKIAEFLGFQMNQEQAQQIANKGTFKSMKEKAKETHGAFANIVFRKGDVGDWRSYFTEAQSEEMDAKFEKHLAGTKLGEMLNYNVYCK
ncbi:sulfotransferase 6B1-like [Rhinophrynus dorsalis]